MPPTLTSGLSLMLRFFEKEFAQSKSFVKQFKDFEEKRLSGTETSFFYDSIARPFIDGISHELTFTYFDIRAYDKPLRNTDKKDDNKLIFILSGESLYFLVSFLNSKLFRFCFSDAFPELQGNSKEIKKFILETIPVKKVSNEEPFQKIVTQILTLKNENPEADTSALEAEIDRLVYELYGLTEEDIGIVEGVN